MTAAPRGYSRFIVRDPTTDEPLVGGRVWTFGAGTANEPKETFADFEKTALLTNPVILQADGGADIFFEGAYKLRIERADGSLVHEIDYHNAGGDAGSGGEAVGSGPQEVKTNDYTITPDDVGKVLLAQRPTAIAFTFAPCADLGAGFAVVIKNIGDGDLTLDPSGSELIDDEPIVILTTGYSALVICDGLTLRTLYFNLASADDFAGVLPIEKGGTGQTAGANMLNGYSGVLPITKGGTGGATAAAARTALGAAAANAVVNLTGTQAIAGTKNFTDNLQRNGLNVASVYAGSAVGNLDFPIGTQVLCIPFNNVNRNATSAVRLSGDTQQFTVGGTAGTLVNGTWRGRGALENANGILMERTA